MALPPPIADLANRADELRDLLTAWANINSGSYNPEGLERMLEALKVGFGRLPGQLRVVTFDAGPSGPDGTGVRLAPRHALRMRCRQEASTRVLLCGHYDTVFGPDHPFQTCQLTDAQTLCGPGVIDMKGGLVVMLAALQAFEALPEAKQLGWEVLISPDEEIGSNASRPLLEEAAERYAFGLVFEPAFGNDIIRSRKGTGEFTVTAIGRAAHAGRDPGNGRNAIVALAKFIEEANALNRQLEGVLINVGHVSGGGPINIVPDYARAGIDVRITTRPDSRRVVQLLEYLASTLTSEGIRVEVAGEFDRMPMESTPASEALFSTLQTCAGELGLNVDWRHSGGGSDGNILAAAGLPVLDGLGPRGNGLHTEGEHVILPSLVERAQLIALFLQRAAMGRMKAPVISRASSRSPF